MRRRAGRLTAGLSAALVALLASCGQGHAGGGARDFLTGLSDGPGSPTATWGSRGAFGSIDGFALLGSGVAVVADATLGRLDLFVDGKRVDTFGQLGPERGDFRSVGAVAALPADTFVVLDPDRGRLVAFRRAGDSVARLGAIELPFRISGVCSLGSRVFVLGRYDGTLVHETTVRGGVVASFGAVEGHTPFEIGLDAAAEIACAPQAGMVAVASRVPGQLRIFDVSGTLVRRDSIPDFVRSPFEHRAAATGGPIPSDVHWNVVKHLEWFGRSLLVQVVRYPKPEPSLGSRWLSAAGAWTTDLPSWPRILGHDAGGRVYVATTEPYPAIEVYRVMR